MLFLILHTAQQRYPPIFLNSMHAIPIRCMNVPNGKEGGTFQNSHTMKSSCFKVKISFLTRSEHAGEWGFWLELYIEFGWKLETNILFKNNKFWLQSEFCWIKAVQCHRSEYFPLIRTLPCRYVSGINFTPGTCCQTDANHNFQSQEGSNCN